MSLTSRLLGALAPGLVFLLLPILALGATAQSGLGDQSLLIAARILQLTNEARRQNGSPPLTAVTTLTRSATGHSREMLELRYFSHHSPTAGLGTPRERMLAAGDRGKRTGENIYRCERVSPEQVAERAVSAWLTSPSHRRVLLNPAYNIVGIGVVGDGQMFWVTQNFSVSANGSRLTSDF